MRLIRTFFHIYPKQSVTALLALLLAGLAEGFGLSMLLPLLGVSLICRVWEPQEWRSLTFVLLLY